MTLQLNVDDIRKAWGIFHFICATVVLVVGAWAGANCGGSGEVKFGIAFAVFLSIGGILLVFK